MSNLCAQNGRFLHGFYVYNFYGDDWLPTSMFLVLQGKKSQASENQYNDHEKNEVTYTLKIWKKEKKKQHEVRYLKTKHDMTIFFVFCFVQNTFCTNHILTLSSHQTRINPKTQSMKLFTFYVAAPFGLFPALSIKTYWSQKNQV